MSFVLDASVSAAWHFRDQDADRSHDLLKRAVREGVLVPSYWQFETASALLSGLRQKRTSPDAVERFFTRMRKFPIEEQQFARHRAFDVHFSLASHHGLRMFDTGYLAIAIEHGLDLATFDRKLANAAEAEGVRLLV